MANIVYDRFGKPSIMNGAGQSGLGYVQSNAGNVEDFNDPNSDLSRGTASLLQSMRMQREAKIKSDGMPESEKLFMIEMRRRKAKEDAANYYKERKLQQDDELIQLKNIELKQKMVEDSVNKTLERNKSYMKFLTDNGAEDTPEARQAHDSVYFSGISDQTPTETTVQDPNTETAKPMTIGQKFSFGKKKDGSENELRKSNLKLQEDTGYIFTPEEEQLSDAEKRNILLQKKSQGGSKDPKEFQANSAIYADRIKESNQILDDLESQGYNRADLSSSLVSGVTNSIPLGIGEALKPEQLKMYEQAKRNFINAVLRKESGAVITDEEIKEADKQYFPVVGDTSKVIDQKRRNRQIAYEGIQRASGRQPDQKQDEQPKSSGITREQAIAELKRRGRI